MIIESGLVRAGLVKTGLVRAISNINTRYFRRNEGTTDYATIPAVTLSGDFAIEFDVYLDVDRCHILSNNSINATGRIFYEESASKIEVSFDTAAITFDVQESLVGVFAKVMLFRESGVVGMLVNGVSRVPSGNTNSDLTLNSIGAIRGNTTSVPALSGILANLEFYDNGTLIRDYPLDDNSDILRNRATVLGGDIGNGVTEFPADTTVTAASGTTASTVYLTTISGLSGGEDFRFSGQSGFESVGNGTFALTAAGSSMQFRSIGVAESGVTISIRQADGYGTVINGNASDWGLFQQQATGEWLGQELSITGTFSSVPIGGDAVSRYDVSPVLGGLSYRLSCAVSLFLGGNDVGFIGTSAGTNIPSSERVEGNANISFDISVDTTSTVQLFSRDVNQCVFNQPSVKEVLNVA